MASKVETASSALTFFERQGALFQKGFSFSGHERDLVCLNRGNGKFLDISGASGLDSITDGRAAVFADLDNDGDTDVFLRAMHDQAHLLFRNDVGQDVPSFRVALEGRASGRDAFGAVVRAKTSAGTLTQVKAGGSGFLSQSDPRLLFGLGNDDAAEWLEISWPSGSKQRMAGPRAGESLLVIEGEATPRPIVEKRFRLPDPEARGEAAWRSLVLRRGDPFPQLALRRPDGSPVDAAIVAPGKRTIVNFWATWCVPCAREMPELQRMAKSSPAGIPVVGISVDDETTRSKVAAHAARLGVTYPIYTADRAALARIFVADVQVPTSIVVDAAGKVVEVVSGASRRDVERLERLAAVPK